MLNRSDISKLTRDKLEDIFMECQIARKCLEGFKKDVGSMFD